MKERRPSGASDDPRHPAVKPCERLSERAEWRRARAALCLPPAPTPRVSLPEGLGHCWQQASLPKAFNCDVTVFFFNFNSNCF